MFTRKQRDWLSEHDLRSLERAAKRCSRLPVGEMLDWAEQALNGMGNGFDDYREHRDPASVEDIRQGVLALLAMITDPRLTSL